MVLIAFLDNPLFSVRSLLSNRGESLSLSIWVLCLDVAEADVGVVDVFSKLNFASVSILITIESPGWFSQNGSAKLQFTLLALNFFKSFG